MRRVNGRVNVTVSRNDVRPEGFKRWTVYAGGRAVFDIEATGLDDGKALIHVLDSGDGHRTFAAYDGRSDSFYHDADSARTALPAGSKSLAACLDRA